MQALHFILTVLSQFLVAIFFLRFALQLVRANFSNPISQFIVSMTNPVVMPLRKIIPGFKGMDLASLVATFLVQLVAIVLINLVTGRGILPVGTTLISTSINLIDLILSLYWILILVRVLLSWVNPDPRNPIVPLLYHLTEPLLAPARRLIPPIGGLDLSAIIVLLSLSAFKILLLVDLLPRFVGHV